MTAKTLRRALLAFPLGFALVSVSGCSVTPIPIPFAQPDTGSVAPAADSGGLGTSDLYPPTGTEDGFGGFADGGAGVDTRENSLGDGGDGGGGEGRVGDGRPGGDAASDTDAQKRDGQPGGDGAGGDTSAKGADGTVPLADH